MVLFGWKFSGFLPQPKSSLWIVLQYLFTLLCYIPIVECLVVLYQAFLLADLVHFASLFISLTVTYIHFFVSACFISFTFLLKKIQ